MAHHIGHTTSLLFSSTAVMFSVIAISAISAATTLAPNIDGLTCPAGFELAKDGQCRGTADKIMWPWNTSLDKSIELCGALEASPLMIKDSEQQNYWEAHTSYNASMPLGIVCNIETNKWKWIDGSAIDYKPPCYDEELDKACVSNAVFRFDNYGYWRYGVRSDMYVFDFNCVSEIRQPVFGHDNCLDIQDPKSPCYQLSESPENWADAQTVCANLGASLASVHSSNENAFIRRLAVSNGFTHGLFLGGTVSGKPNNFWVDGSDLDYDNFNPGFPSAGYGDCVVMDTHDSAGKWVNSECSEPLNFVCSRLAYAAPNKTCAGPDTKEGALIYTPGFPTDASIPCEFFLKVDAGKQVEVEVVLLEANSCCDRLNLYEGSFGDTFIAGLTGAMSGATYRTTSSNVMRVSWEPQGGVNVRGAVITFRGV